MLGIHDLPGGFGRHVLVPVRATLPVPDTLPSDTAVLIEPFAAALHAVATVAPRHGETVAVLGPRRLGLLVIAALRADAARRGIALEILALSRRPPLLDLARRLGATATGVVDGRGDGLADGLADVVIDTTGNPDALRLAVRLARRETHLKSTHGQPSCGIRHITEMVVDELGLERWSGEARAGAGAAGEVVDLRDGRPAAAALADLEHAGGGGLPRAATAVVDTAAQLDDAVRPDAERELALVRPRAAIQVAAATGSTSPLLRAVADRGLRFTTSRCGSFAAALELLNEDPALRRLGEVMVTHRLPASELAAAFATARSGRCIKAVVDHVVAP